MCRRHPHRQRQPGRRCRSSLERWEGLLSITRDAATAAEVASEPPNSPQLAVLVSREATHAPPHTSGRPFGHEQTPRTQEAPAGHALPHSPAVGEAGAGWVGQHCRRRRHQCVLRPQQRRHLAKMRCACRTAVREARHQGVHTCAAAHARPLSGALAHALAAGCARRAGDATRACRNAWQSRESGRADGSWRQQVAQRCPLLQLTAAFDFGGK